MMNNNSRKILATMTCLVMLVSILAAFSGALATGGADRSETLMIYGNSAGDGKDVWLIEQAKAAGFNIQCVEVPGGDLLNRLIAEKNNQQADVIWGMNAMSYEAMKKEDLLLQFAAPSWVSDCAPALGDPEGYYYPIVVQPLLLAYNTTTFTDAVPTDWVEAITDEKFAGTINILSLGGTTSQCIIAGILVRYREDGAEHNISAEGWEVMRKYIQENHVNHPEEDWFGNFTNATFPITNIWGSGYIQRQLEMNFTDMGYATPEVGVPYVVEQLAITKNTKKAALAQEFIEWFGSPEIQGEFSALFGTAPACDSALAKASPEIQEMLESVHPQEIDWKFVGDNRDAWMEKIELEFVL